MSFQPRAGIWPGRSASRPAIALLVTDLAVRGVVGHRPRLPRPLLVMHSIHADRAAVSDAGVTLGDVGTPDQ